MIVNKIVSLQKIDSPKIYKQGKYFSTGFLLNFVRFQVNLKFWPNLQAKVFKIKYFINLLSICLQMALIKLFFPKD